MPDFYPALAMVCRTDLVTFAPTAMVEAAQVTGIVALALPFELPRIDVAQTWHRRYTHDNAHLWPRASVRRVCSNPGGAAQP